MLQRRSILKSVAVFFLLTSLAFLGLHAEVIAAQLTLSWTDNSTSEGGFNIERRPASSTTFAQIATVAGNVTTYTDGALPGATTYCYQVQAFNTAGSSGYSNEQCATTTAATTNFTLTVNRSGTGSGTVTSSPTGINCGTTCSGTYNSDGSVVLTAAAASGSTFGGWSGSGCTGTGATCTLTMTAATTVTATFNVAGAATFPVNLQGGSLPEEATVSISVSKPQNATSATLTLNAFDPDYADEGSVYINGNGPIALFGAQVGADFETKDTLFQTPAAWWVDGSNELRFIHTSTTGYRINSASVQFVGGATTNYTLTVNKSGTGSGTVTGTGITCGTDCLEPYTSGTSVVLTAAAASGSTFGGWSGGGCTGTGATCTLTMSAATAVTASFNSASSFALNVNVAVQATSGGSANGRVVSNPVGIDCGTDCTETYPSGRVVVLTPTPGTGSLFAGWTGNSDCTNGSVTMNANKSCTANFALVQALLTVTTIGNGTVNSTSAGVTCGSTCSYGFSLGSTVTLRAVPAGGSKFVSWSGAGCQGSGSCSVTLSTNKSVTASFTGSGAGPTDKIGVYRPSTGRWVLDLNGNGVLESCSIDHCVSTFRSPAGIPVVSDWDGSGVSQIGFFHTDAEEWHLDLNANETWDGCGVDDCIRHFGRESDIPVTGKWSLKGIDRIGFFRPSNGRWYLDRNGNDKWNGCIWDRCANLQIYQDGDLPVTGDWNGNETTQVGLFRPATGEWFLDSNGNRRWDGCGMDRCLSSFGTAADLPVSGDWNGTGTSKIGVFRPSTGEWFLDLNGNGQWDGCSVDLCRTFGRSGDRPIVGKW